jgi:hypothetical protein
MNLAKNQFTVGSEVWTVTEDDDGTLRANAPGHEAVAFMTESGSFPEQAAALCAKLCAWAYAKGKAEGKEEVCASWEKFASREAAKAKEALAS